MQAITNDNELRDALVQIEVYWKAPSDTPQGRKLEELVDAVCAYEDKHHPVI